MIASSVVAVIGAEVLLGSSFYPELRIPSRTLMIASSSVVAIIGAEALPGLPFHPG